MPDGKLTLISHPPCPFVQRAAIVLLEKGVPFERIDIDLAAKPEWFLALSPTGKVPLLTVRQADGTDAILFESMVICEYIEEAEEGASLYFPNALSRAQQRAWVEFGTAALSEAWQWLNHDDSRTADAKRVVLQDRFRRIEAVLEQGPYFSGSMFSMVDAVFAPVFRYFDCIDPAVSEAIFNDLPRVSAWRHALASRQSVISAVREDYADLFQQHLLQHGAALASSRTSRPFAHSKR
ncbi:glutathione S-transferase family protein [Mesorhizobium calcicola]|uniref:glutathione transferase n=1 Tax=Mesorhizobium calcicola TaxID=1300310 RepID=A0ABW4WCZ3_9HYPH